MVEGILKVALWLSHMYWACVLSLMQVHVHTHIFIHTHMYLYIYTIITTANVYRAGLRFCLVSSELLLCWQGFHEQMNSRSKSISKANTGKQTELSQEHNFLEDLVVQSLLRQPWLQMFKPVLFQWGRGDEHNSPFLRIPLNCQVRESIPRNIPEGKYACQSRLPATSHAGSQQEMFTGG